MERGTVFAVAADRRRFAVSVDGDSCATFELGAPAEVAVGHRLRGKLESEFCFALENLSTGETLDVARLGHHASADEAKRAIGA
jgi:hypothetical protein